MKTLVLNNVDVLKARKGMDNTWEIFDIKVLSKRGVGIGRQLFEKLLEKNPRLVYAFTRENNGLGRAFYKALGFREILIPQFYEEGNAIMVIYENSLYRKICKS